MNLRLENIHVRYGRLEALTGVSCEARPGRITVVIGPNAAGKSTLLRCGLGLIRPSDGNVWLNSRNVLSLTPRRRAQLIAYLAQQPSVSASFSVREVIELGRYVLPPDQSRIDNVLYQLDLRDLADRAFHELSAGQQQRVSLARAIAQHETGGCLILDEPTSAMDLNHARTAALLLRDLAGQGSTIIIALHDFTLAGAIADDVWLLDAGRLVAAGPAADVLTPEVLQPVFGVSFQSISTSSGATLIVANPLSADAAVE